MPRSRQLLAVAAALALSLALASCVASPPAPTPTVKPAATRHGDGVLKVGTVFPVSGSASYLGPAQAAGVDAAVHDINAAGGVLGKPVQVFHDDSGDASTTTLETSFADLQAKGVDALIGPSTSVLAERLLPKIVAARIPMITPAATSVRLTGLDDDNYLFRTMSSAALQGGVLARLLGKARVALVYLDDDTGAAVKATLTAGLAKSGGTLVTAQPFAVSATNLAPVVAAVIAAKPDAVVLVSPFGAMDQNKAVITQLTAAGLGGAKLWLTTDNMADYSQAMPAGALTNVNGILAGAEPDAAFTAMVKAANPAVTSTLYSAEAYDATILAALAATVAHDDSGAAIASHLRAVSVGGIKCTSFAECLQVLKTQPDIDYDGYSGPVNLDAQGDPSPAHYGVYRYDAANRFARVSGITAG